MDAHCLPHPEPPSVLPPQPILYRYSSAPALSTLPHASNLVWWSVSRMLIYMFNFILTKVIILLSLPRTVPVYAFGPGGITDGASSHFSLLIQFRWQTSTNWTLPSGVIFWLTTVWFKFNLQHKIYRILPLFRFPLPTATNTLNFKILPVITVSL